LADRAGGFWSGLEDLVIDDYPKLSSWLSMVGFHGEVANRFVPLQKNARNQL